MQSPEPASRSATVDEVLDSLSRVPRIRRKRGRPRRSQLSPAKPSPQTNALTTELNASTEQGNGISQPSLPTSDSLAKLLRAEIAGLVRVATESNDPDVATRLLGLAERIEARAELTDEDRDRSKKALEMVRTAEALSPLAILDRAVRVLEQALALDPTRLDQWTRRLRNAAGQARPTT